MTRDGVYAGERSARSWLAKMLSSRRRSTKKRRCVATDGSRRSGPRLDAVLYIHERIMPMPMPCSRPPLGDEYIRPTFGTDIDIDGLRIRCTPGGPVLPPAAVVGGAVPGGIVVAAPRSAASPSSKVTRPAPWPSWLRLVRARTCGSFGSSQPSVQCSARLAHSVRMTWSRQRPHETPTCWRCPAWLAVMRE